tara:strand:+ start:782 stop:1237 length:456 start_codon:yes stop_codon:yes gene_type:complete
MIFKNITLFLCLLILGCTSTEERISTNNANVLVSKEFTGKSTESIPNWLSSPPNNTVSSCVKIKGNDTYTAKIIVLAKAKAELLTSRMVDIESEVIITEKHSRVEGESTNNSEYHSNLKLKSSGSIGHKHGVIKEEQLYINKQKNICILFG